MLTRSNIPRAALFKLSDVTQLRTSTSCPFPAVELRGDGGKKFQYVQLSLSSSFSMEGKGGCRRDGRGGGDGKRGWQFYKGDDF